MSVCMYMYISIILVYGIKKNRSFYLKLNYVFDPFCYKLI